MISNNLKDLTEEDLTSLLQLEDEKKIESLYRQAYEKKVEQVGKKVYFRGIIEFSNHCQKNCLYCGIRRDNNELTRFEMDREEIIKSARWVHNSGYGSLVLQSGEIQGEEFTEYIEGIIRDIKEISKGELGITLSLGEQKKETYRRWFEAGAHRYLLRIETTNPDLYAELHPEDHQFQERLNCLKTLQDIGYQTGTGVMIGLPGQTPADLAADLKFFQRQKIDMIGMGPYVPHSSTPLASGTTGDKIPAKLKEKNLDLSLKMVSLLRILVPDVNIAATTALQALHPLGREKALQAGANILMPVVTPQKYREDYKLYENKPCIDEKAEDCRGCISNRVKSIGEEIAYDEWGDSRRYFRRLGNRSAELRGEIDAENAAG